MNECGVSNRSAVICYSTGDRTQSAIAACLNIAEVDVDGRNEKTSSINRICNRAPHRNEPNLLIFSSSWTWRWTKNYWNQLLRYYDYIYYVQWQSRRYEDFPAEPRVIIASAVQLLNYFPTLVFNNRAQELVYRLQKVDEWKDARARRKISRDEPPPDDIYIISGVERILYLQNQRRLAHKKTAYSIVRYYIQSDCSNGNAFGQLIERGKIHQHICLANLERCRAHQNTLRDNLVRQPSTSWRKRRRRRSRNEAAKSSSKERKGSAAETVNGSSVASPSEVECLKKELQEQRAAINALRTLLEIPDFRNCSNFQTLKAEENSLPSIQLLTD